ncbi:MAG: hypothetical protein ACREXT_02275 [Gammaproteobacteria bacterium]
MERVRGLRVLGHQIDRTPIVNASNSGYDSIATSIVASIVALEGDCLVAHASSLREVYRLSDEAGVKVPFIAYIEPADALLSRYLTNGGTI